VLQIRRFHDLFDGDGLLKGVFDSEESMRLEVYGVGGDVGVVD